MLLLSHQIEAAHDQYEKAQELFSKADAKTPDPVLLNLGVMLELARHYGSDRGGLIQDVRHRSDAQRRRDRWCRTASRHRAETPFHIRVSRNPIGP